MLQSMVAPALDAWKRTAAQKAIAAIPGLGDLAEGTAQVLLGSAVLVKNSLGMFVGILLAVLLVVPLLKIAAYGCLLYTSFAGGKSAAGTGFLKAADAAACGRDSGRFRAGNSGGKACCG